MWVRLTRQGLASVRRWTLTDGAMYDEINMDVRPWSKTSVDVFAPYATWKFVWQTLYDRSFSPLGGRLPKIASRDYTALQNITKALNRVDSHPALRGLGMFEWQRTIIPAWRVEPTEKDPRLFHPYPLLDHQFVVLTPYWDKVKNTKVTRWVAQASGEGRICDESVHLALRRIHVRH